MIFARQVTPELIGLLKRVNAAVAADSEGRLGSFAVGGPGGGDFLDAEGELWSWCVLDDTVERVADGPRKVGAVAIAAERVPELGGWLPRRPAGALNCRLCAGNGKLPPPCPYWMQCTECSGLGWVTDRG